jgi:hypothetical protein
LHLHCVAAAYPLPCTLRKRCINRWCEATRLQVGITNDDKSCCCCCCCRLPPDAKIADQVAVLNAAYNGAVKFVTQQVYRYQISDFDPASPPSGAGICIENPACYDPNFPILISYKDWWDTTTNGFYPPLYGDFKDGNLINALATKLYVPGPSVSHLNIFMWDW